MLALTAFFFFKETLIFSIFFASSATVWPVRGGQLSLEQHAIGLPCLTFYGFL